MNKENFDDTVKDDGSLDVIRAIDSVFYYSYGWNSKTPIYDDQADYNTNSKSYYDFLARWNKYLKWLTMLVNRLMRRNISVKDTTTIDFTKEGDWLNNGNCRPNNYNDVITLSAKVIFSKKTKKDTFLTTEPKEQTIKNGSVEETDGVWSPDYGDVLHSLDNTINNIIDSLTKDGQVVSIQNIYTGTTGGGLQEPVNYETPDNTIGYRFYLNVRNNPDSVPLNITYDWYEGLAKATTVNQILAPSQPDGEGNTKGVNITTLSFVISDTSAKISQQTMYAIRDNSGSITTHYAYNPSAPMDKKQTIIQIYRVDAIVQVKV